MGFNNPTQRYIARNNWQLIANAMWDRLGRLAHRDMAYRAGIVHALTTALSHAHQHS